MYKRTSSCVTFSAVIFTMLCLFPSVVGAQAPGELQQQKDPPPPKGSRSNIHNNRTGVGRFDPIMIDLGKASGDKVATRKIADADDDGKISQAEGTFDFGVLPAGDYVLSFRLGDKIDTVESNLGREATSQSGPRESQTGLHSGKQNSDVDRFQLTLDGVAGGTLKQELKADLGSQIGAEVARAGKPKFENILFKADGRSAVKGTMRHDMVKSSIRNLK